MTVLAIVGALVLLLGAVVLLRVAMEFLASLSDRAERRRAYKRELREAIRLEWNTTPPPLGVLLLVRHSGVNGGIDIMRAYEQEYDDGTSEICLTSNLSKWGTKAAYIGGWLPLDFATQTDPEGRPNG